ncbi:response regulator [Myxococcaceae bacterium GXIMD 01537]
MSDWSQTSGTGERERWAEAGLLAPGFVHELRHPLMGLKAGLQMLERRWGTSAPVDEAWSLVTGQVSRLEELLRGYEDFLRPGASGVRAFPVQPVVRRSVDLLGWRLRSLGASFLLEMPAEAVGVSGTPEALLHALTNVLVNALDANEEAGGKGRLAVRLLVLEGLGRVQVRVSDEGTGIAPEVAPRLFEPRFTTKPPGRGTGLGLGVARRLMAEVGGAVRLVENDDPRRLAWGRTEFCIELTASSLGGPALVLDPTPSTPPPVEGAPLRVAPEPAPGPAPVAREEPARILVVDDEAIILMLLEKALTLEGYTVVTAPDGPAAAERLRTERFNLLVTDKNLPGTSGVELAALGRAQNPDLGIVLTTAYATHDSAQAMVRLQADAYLTKPFDTEVLVEHVRQTLARRRSLTRLRAVHGGAPVVARVQSVLVVEPDLTSRMVVVRHLQRAGMHVRVARDVLSGLCQGPPPLDALVAPAALLGNDARQEVRRLLVRRPGFRVVVISEPRSLGDSVTAIAVGAREQLVRPLSEAEVRRVLTQAFAPGPGGAA